MEIVNRYTDMANKYRVVVQITDIYSLPLKFQTQVDDSVVFSKAQEIYDSMIAQQEIDSWKTVSFDILENKELLKEVIIRLKNNPTTNLTQYNTYLGTKQWYEAATIRYFVYKLALGLAQHYGVVLANYTESQILQKVRDWIVATPLRKIAKVIMNNVNELE